jgi:nucleotide-binding universal stress UspA family protein
MLSKILAAIDHSAVSKQVFDEALALARIHQGKLILLHVLSVEEPTSPFMSSYLVQHKDRCIHVDPRIMHQANEVYDCEWSDFKQQGIRLLGSYAQKAMSSTSSANAVGVNTEFTQITGSPSSTICEFAQSCHADVIVIGRRGHSGLQEMLLGSVSNYVVHHAPCSILLVQTPILEQSISPASTETTVYAGA